MSIGPIVCGTGKACARECSRLASERRHDHHVPFVGAVVPDYHVVDDDVEELKDVCYRALMKGSAVDQYQVAMMLRGQLATQVTEAEASEDPTLSAYMKQFEFNPLAGRALDLLRPSVSSRPRMSLR